MLDASVDFPQLEGDFFEFEKKFLGIYDSDDVLTMSSWVRAHTSSESNRLILQMDIEGSEYEVLAFEPASVLSRFACMVIEFHDFHKLFDPNFCFVLNGIFEKIYTNFTIVHAHPSSYRKLIKNDGIAVPPTIEITFLRNDVLQRLGETPELNLPNELDIKLQPHAF